MNKQRRKDLGKALEHLNAANESLGDTLTDLEGIRDEEQEAAESVGEAFPGSERAETMEAAVASLEEAISVVEDMMSRYDEALDYIEQAAE